MLLLWNNGPKSPHLRLAAIYAKSACFSISAHHDIRQRPIRRQSQTPISTVKTPTDSLENEFSEDRGTRAHDIASASAPQPQAHNHPQSQDTSTSGPYKQVLLTSKSIRHSPSPANHQNVTTNLTARISKSQAQQLSAAEKFFSSPTKFLYSAEALHHHSLQLFAPEIVILGSSNVGKSTFLNALVGQSSAARVSQRPGHTTLLNAFGVGPLPRIPRELVPKGTPPPKHSLIVVDTPGYGYKSQASWGDAIMKYLQNRRMLRGAVVLLSSEKKNLLAEDRWILRTLAEANIRTLVVLTKADKARSLWAEKCSAMADSVQRELDNLNAEFGGKWRASMGTAGQICVTAAGMASPGKLRNGGGVGGVRTAILDMAGFTLQQTVTKKAETVSYTGPVVSFDDIQWK